MKRIIAATLAAALIAPSIPAFAAESPAETAALEQTISAIAAAQPATHAPVSIRTSAKEAVGSEAAAYGPRSMPRQGNDGTRYQGGGGKTGMIVGLVSAAAGVAATVYMVKYMKKSTDAAKTN
jgi:hypothetical protein